MEYKQERDMYVVYSVFNPMLSKDSNGLMMLIKPKEENT